MSGPGEKRAYTVAAEQMAGGPAPAWETMEEGSPQGGSFEARRAALKTSFGTQANALFRKNVVYQKRNWCTNCCLIALPVVLCILLVLLQAAVNAALSGSSFKCGCDKNNSSRCGIEYSDVDNQAFCGIVNPTQWPSFLQTPAPSERGYHQGSTSAAGCRNTSSCKNTFLYTGANKATADRLGSLLLGTSTADALRLLSASNAASLLNTSLLDLGERIPPGTSSQPSRTTRIEAAFFDEVYLLLNSTGCSSLPLASISLPYNLFSRKVDLSLSCVGTDSIWRPNASAIHDEQYKGYKKANPEGVPSEIGGAYDFGKTDATRYDVVTYFNRTFQDKSGNGPPRQVRIGRAQNLAVNAFLQNFKPGAAAPFRFVSEMPSDNTQLRLDFSSLLGPLFFVWVLQLLFPVIVSYIVYDKEKKLRVMMKMHGLGDGPYWLVQYLYFFVLSCLYMLLFIIAGSAVRLKFFSKNDYSIQVLFYFVFANFQIAFAFFAAVFFTNTKVANIVSYIWVFLMGLLAQFLYSYFLEDPSFSRGAVLAMELIPVFSLYRGLYEFSYYAFVGDYQGEKGLTWARMSESGNGLPRVFVIMMVEWVVFLALGLYFDQTVSAGSGVRRGWLFPLEWCFKGKGGGPAGSRRASLTEHAPSLKGLDVEREDVVQERNTVEGVVQSGNISNTGYSILCNGLKKVYKGRDGNPDKHAVKNLFLAVARGECFGMLGANGAGKTTSISMMVGLLDPTSGTAFIEGMDIRTEMNKIYGIMGVCPQHDLIWEQLTGREHLLFYGRLKNLKGPELQAAVERSLRSVNLWTVAQKPAGKYSGGMKRRLSVAISLIGNPLVVYMDEPSTGLDPASRNNLWNVVKAAKQNRAIILTTHSMEEAEFLCDRLGIFTDGQFEVIGPPRELTARYGGSFVFTITTPPEQEPQAEELVRSFSPSAQLVYSLGGTQKFELPVAEVDMADVFAAVEKAKRRLTVQAWGIANTTLEDVFIKLAKNNKTNSILA